MGSERSRSMSKSEDARERWEAEVRVAYYEVTCPGPVDEEEVAYVVGCLSDKEEEVAGEIWASEQGMHPEGMRSWVLRGVVLGVILAR